MTESYCISARWFQHWSQFVTDKRKDPPGPIDNRSIVTSATKNGSQSTTSTGVALTLKPMSNYMQTSGEVWNLFHSIYGGGPVVVTRGNGQVIVSDNQLPVEAPADPDLELELTSPNLRPLASRRRGKMQVYPGNVARVKTSSESEEVRGDHYLRHRSVSEGDVGPSDSEVEEE